MAEPEVEEAVDEVEHQERLVGNEDVSSNAQHPNLSFIVLKISHPYLEDLLCPKSRMPVWLSKENSVFQMRKKVLWRKKHGCKVTVQIGIALRGAGFQPPNAKELLAINQVLPQLRH